MEQVKEYAPFGQQVVGTLLSAQSASRAGKAQQRANEYEARQLETNAGQQQAAAQRAAAERERQAVLMMSRAQAVAAASGAGALDPTVLKIISGIAEEGALASATELYDGDERARGMRDQAAASRFEGKMFRRAGRTRALTTLFTGLDRSRSVWGDSWEETKRKSYPGADYGKSSQKSKWES